MNNLYPHELQIAQLYISPIIVVALGAFFLAAMSAIILNKTKISHFFIAHQYVFLAMFILYALAIDHFFIRF